LNWLLWIGLLVGIAAWLLALLAVIFGIIGLTRTKRLGSSGAALTGLIIGFILLPVPLIMIVLMAAASTPS
jgi:hypothetical protein